MKETWTPTSQAEVLALYPREDERVIREGSVIAYDSEAQENYVPVLCWVEGLGEVWRKKRHDVDPLEWMGYLIG